MRSIEITNNVQMEFPSGDMLTAIHMWNDIGSVIRGIQLSDVQEGAVLRVRPTLQELTSVAYKIIPERCAIDGYTPVSSNYDPCLIEVTATDISGGVKVSGRVMITGKVEVTINYKPVIEGTCRVIR